MEIMNVPAYAQDRAFIVAREVDGIFWFWGAYNDRAKANEAAIEMDGVVFPNDATA